MLHTPRTGKSLQDIASSCLRQTIRYSSPDAEDAQRHLEQEEAGEGEADDGQLLVQMAAEVGQVDDHYRDVDENEH